MCERCATLERLLADSQDSEREMAETISALQRQMIRTARAEQATRNELNRVRETSPRAQQVRGVCDHWQKTHPRAKCPANGKRWQKVDARLRDGFTADQLVKAVDGCMRFPFVAAGGRRSSGKQAERYDDLELICRDEATVERFIELADRVDEPVAPPARPRSHQRHAAPVHDPMLEVQKALTAYGCQWRASGDGQTVMSQCPAHDDRQASLKVFWASGYPGEPGKLLVHCFAGCETVYVMDALGMALADLFERSNR
jgi:hypothetical protein